jgi:KUP system potassium uptake protein
MSDDARHPAPQGGRRPGMARWREHLFAFMSRNASPLPDFFRIPRNRIVELGSVVEI